MANIKIELGHPIIDGMPLSFRAPCNCTEVNGIKVSYPDGEDTAFIVFSFADAHGNDLTGLGNLFAANAMVRVILDPKNAKAYIQNADTNAYIEGKFAQTVTKQYVDSRTPNIVTGTYVGTNKSGADNPNILIFDFVPKMLIVRESGERFSMVIDLMDATEEYSDRAAHVISNVEAGGSDLDYYHAVQYGFYIKVVGNTVYWYYKGASDDSLGDRRSQFNFGKTYTYMAIGDSASGSGGGTDAPSGSGFVLVDQTTGIPYKVYVDNGNLKMEGV